MKKKDNGIPEGKKRYSITLTEATMTRMQAYMKKSGAPLGMISAMIDELLQDVLKTFDELEVAQQRQGGELGMGNLLTTIGKIMIEKDSKQEKLL